MRLKKNPLSGHRGFSLLELILVTALLPVVSFAVYGNLSSGARLWQTLIRPTPVEDLNIFYRKTSTDFTNAFKYADIPFVGTSEEATLATRINTVAELGGDRGIGQVRYGYDSSLKAIFKEESNLHEIYKEKTPQKKILLKEVVSFRVSYLGFVVLDNAFEWKEEWEPSEEQDKLPVAVRFRFRQTGQEEEQSMTFEIPVGG